MEVNRLKKILVVDDSALMRRVIFDIINKDRNLHVEKYATNGLDALDLLVSGEKFDAIVLDINMPKMNGIEFLRELKKRGMNEKVLIVSTLAKEGAKETIQALELGAFDFVTKPDSLAIAKGTGIGLSLVRDLVVLHHGSISVESEEGKGTAFKIEFPVHRFAYSEEEIDDAVTLLDSDGIDAVQEDVLIEDIQTSALEDNVVSAEQNVAEKSHTLLLVEDNEDLLGLMVKLLGTDYKIHTATNGKEALEIVESEDIDLIVSDVMMPVMDGIEFCRSIKGNFDTSHIPLILLTAKKQEEDRVEAYESGADAFITKPFNLSVLHARIGNLLKSRERVMKDFKKQLVFEAKELNYTSMDEDFLQRAIDCVNRHLDDPGFDQTQFLEEMNTTKSTFFRKLKSLTGLTYVSFIRNIRMKAACHIMEEKKHVRISELASGTQKGQEKTTQKTYQASKKGYEKSRKNE